MKQLFRTLVIFALFFLFCTSNQAVESVSVLLEKAIYQEETVGDLDEAIRIYQKIAQEAEANRPIIAQALYRLGLCYSKKGEPEKAIELYKKIIQEYPEQKKQVEAAKIQMSQIPKNHDFLPLNQVVERTVYDDGEAQEGKEILIDFDTGKLLTLPEELRNQPDGMRVFRTKGIDAGCETSNRGPGLYGGDMIVLPVANAAWDNAALAEGLMDDLKWGTPGTPTVMSAKGELPATYLFQTREKSIGILQILELQDGTRPRHIKIQYKLLEYGLNEISSEKKLEAEKLGSEGWQLWKNRDLEAAEKKFQEAVEIDPSLDSAWNGLGWAQLNQGQSLVAKQSFEKCLQLEPNHPAALNGLGWIAKDEGKIDKAIGYWQDAINATPGATAALNGLATTYIEQKKYDKAIEIYEKWLQVEPNNPEVRSDLEKAIKLLLSSKISHPEQQKSTTSSPNSESDLAKERDRAMIHGELVKACDWEMKRVLLRKETGHAYKDKVSLESLYEDLIRREELSSEKKQSLYKEVQEYLKQHQGEEEYEWRLYSLLSTITQDMGQLEEAAQFLDQALKSYPFVAYPCPDNFSKYHHLVNTRAGMIWDKEGVEAAENYFLDHLTNDKKCEYFFEYWWKNKYDDSQMEQRHGQMLKKVKEVYQTRIQNFPEKKTLIERYLSELDEAIKMREKSR